MTIFLTLIHVLVCFVLIVVILVQGGRGQGLTGSSFSSGNVQSLLGTQAADFLTKATTVSAILFLFTCIGLNLVESKKSRSVLGNTRETAPVDIDAVKKALAKVGSEKTADVQSAAASAATTAGDKVNALGNDLKAAAQQTASDVKNEASQVTAQAQAAASASPKS